MLWIILYGHITIVLFSKYYVLKKYLKLWKLETRKLLTTFLIRSLNRAMTVKLPIKLSPNRSTNCVYTGVTHRTSKYLLSMVWNGMIFYVKKLANGRPSG